MLEVNNVNRGTCSLLGSAFTCLDIPLYKLEDLKRSKKRTFTDEQQRAYPADIGTFVSM